MRTGEMVVAVSGKGRKGNKELLCPPLKDSKFISFQLSNILESKLYLQKASDRTQTLM
jgi:hypothetical protein